MVFWLRGTGRGARQAGGRNLRLTLEHDNTLDLPYCPTVWVTLRAAPSPLHPVKGAVLLSTERAAASYSEWRPLVSNNALWASLAPTCEEPVIRDEVRCARVPVPGMPDDKL